MYPAPNHYPIQHNLDNDTIFSMTHVTPGADNKPSTADTSHLKLPPDTYKLFRASSPDPSASSTYVAMDGHPDTYLCYNNEQAMKREMHLLSLFKKFMEIQNVSRPTTPPSPALTPVSHSSALHPTVSHTTAYSTDSALHSTAYPTTTPNPSSTLLDQLLRDRQQVSESALGKGSSPALLYVALGVILVLLLLTIFLFAMMLRMNRRFRILNGRPPPRPAAAAVSSRQRTTKKKKRTKVMSEEQWLEVMKKSVRAAPAV